MSKISESCYRLAKLGEVLDFNEMLVRGKSMSDELKRQMSAAGHTTSDPP